MKGSKMDDLYNYLTKESLIKIIKRLEADLQWEKEQNIKSRDKLIKMYEKRLDLYRNLDKNEVNNGTVERD